MTKVTFQEYGVSGTKSGICSVCGERATRVVKFSQTQNPFNKNKSGKVKNIEEILAECRHQLFEWKDKPIKHARCEED